MTSDGVTIGNGGDGSSGGNGGVVTLLLKEKETGSNLSIAGGMAGTGGRGGRPSSTLGGVCETVCPWGINGSDGTPGISGAIKYTSGRLLLLSLPAILPHDK